MIVRARIKPIFEGSMFKPFQPFQSFNLLRHRVAKKSKTYKFEACKKPSIALIDISINEDSCYYSKYEICVIGNFHTFCHFQCSIT